MKKIRLLLMLMVSMLAIGVHAQTDDDWAEKGKAGVLKIPGGHNLGDFVTITPSFAYFQGFTYAQGDDILTHNYHPFKTNTTIKLDRNEETGVFLLFYGVTNPDKSITSRPEFKQHFQTVMNDAYGKNYIYRDYTSDLSTLSGQFHSGQGIIDQMNNILIKRAGEYSLHVYKDNRVIDHEMDLIVNAEPEIRVEVEADETMGFVLNTPAKFKAVIASGYPYKDLIANYQGKKMHVQVFDADNKKLDEADIELKASNDSTRIEYLATKTFYTESVKSTKYIFKFTGPLLKDGKELVITKEVLPLTSGLSYLIQQAEIISAGIKNEPALAFHAFRGELLQEAADKAKECLTLTVEEQSKINQATISMDSLITSVQKALTKKIVYVNSADSLMKVIAADHAAQIQLTTNIDISGIEGSLFNGTFTGTINGRKENLPERQTYAFVGDLNDLLNDSTQHPISYLFEGAKDAFFTNLTFKNILVRSDNNDLGVISRTANNCKYHNIQMKNVKVDCNKGRRAGTITGHAIDCVFDNINISNSLVLAEYDRVGSLTGQAEGCTIRNCYNDPKVGIYAGSWEGSSQSGGFSGSSIHALFQNCENHAFVAGTYSDIGGITGSCSYSQILDCSNAGIITGVEDKRTFHLAYTLGDKSSMIRSARRAGGICSQASDSSIERCTNNGQVNGGNCGGIACYTAITNFNNCLNEWDCSFVYEIRNGKITNCLNLADCVLIGYNRFVPNANDPAPESANNYSLLNPGSTRTIAASYEMGVTEEQLRSGIVARWLNNGIQNRQEGIEPWRQNIKKTFTDNDYDAHPVLDPSHRIVTIEELPHDYIRNGEQLRAFAERVNAGDQFACAALYNDIDLTGISINWIPIGKDETNKHFRGIFDGKGHTINIECTSDKNEPVGLFGAVHANAEIRNVIIGENSKLKTGDAGAGGIVGRVYIGWTWGNVVIENCGSFVDKIEVKKHGGGILGRVTTGHDDDNVKVFVNNCFSLATVHAEEGNSASLCGYMKHTGVVSNCWSGGQLKDPVHDSSAYDENNPKKQAECFVGYSNRLDIKNCYIVKENRIAWTWLWTGKLQDGVKTISDDDLSHGKLAYLLNCEVNDTTKSLVWQQNISKDEYPEFGSKGVYHTRDVSNEYGTVCLPYAVKSGGNTLYYTLREFKDNNGEMEMKFVYTTDVIPAGTPVLYRVGRTGENAFYGAVGAASGWADEPEYLFADRWKMVGTYTDETWKKALWSNIANIYYISNGTIMNATYSVTVPAYRAYFVKPTIDGEQNSSSEARIRIVIEDENGETTAIQLINDELAPSFNNDQAPSFGNGKTYSLMGTEVGKGYRGIVIRNGKKILVK